MIMFSHLDYIAAQCLLLSVQFSCKFSTRSFSFLLGCVFQLFFHALLFLVHGHFLLHLFVLEVEIVRNSPLVDIGFKRRLDQRIDATYERLVHHVLVSEIWHLVRFRSVDVATKLCLLSLFGLLSCFDPRLILGEFSMALLCLLFEFFPPRAFLHVVLTFRNRAENMRDIVLAVDCHRIPRFGHVWVSIVEPGLLIFFEFAPMP